MENNEEKLPDALKDSEEAGPSNNNQEQSSDIGNSENGIMKNRKFATRSYRSRNFSDSDSEDPEIGFHSEKRPKSETPDKVDSNSQMETEEQNADVDAEPLDALNTEDSPELNIEEDQDLANQRDDDNDILDGVGPRSNSSDGADDDDSSLSSSILSPLLYILGGGGRARYSSSDSSDSDQSSADKKKVDDFTKELLDKEKPKQDWLSCREILMREMNGNRCSYNKLFEMRNYGSLTSVERLELMAKLKSHSSCVNCLNFNKTGEFLVSGSDDLKIVLWKWSIEKPVKVFRTCHTKNIFQTKFVEENSCHVKIVSASAEGSVFLSTFPSSGDEVMTKRLFNHAGAVHKLCVKGDYFLSSGEDGKVMKYDLRSKEAQLMVMVRDKYRKVPLFSIAGHPLEEKFIVTGRDTSVRVYDLRSCKKPIKTFCPKALVNRKHYNTYISCAVYNYDGTEILASYNNDFIYLFDSSNNNDDITGQNYLHRYQGHYNSATVKGVNFFGPRSEYIVSGSDCGNIYFWSKEHESIIQWMRGDEEGVVNVLEPHPHIPILATSGLDSDIKIWIPSNENSNTFDGLEKCIRKNCRLQMRAEEGTTPAEIRGAFLRRYRRQLENRLRNFGERGDWLDFSDSSDSDD